MRLMSALDGQEVMPLPQPAGDVVAAGVRLLPPRFSKNPKEGDPDVAFIEARPLRLGSGQACA
jgi:hypothetical protein